MPRFHQISKPSGTTWGSPLIQGYGLKETAALVTLNHPFRVGRGTIGKALPGREVRLSDTGELLVRGDNIAQATSQNGRLQLRDTEWLATGDLAELNASGEFRFLGLQSDAIISSSALNIHPADLEVALRRQPGVVAAAIVPCELTMGPEPIAVMLFQGHDAALHQATRTAPSLTSSRSAAFCAGLMWRSRTPPLASSCAALSASGPAAPSTANQLPQPTRTTSSSRLSPP